MRDLVQIREAELEVRARYGTILRMVKQTGTFDEADAKTKWQQLAPLVDRMMERVGTEGEFPVAAGSSLAGDDAAADPYQVSHVIRMCLTAGTDHLHAAKVLVVDQQVVHVAAPASLARGALETLAAAYWVLQPTQRDERVTRSLRWHTKNMRDAEAAVGDLKLPGHTPLEEKLLKLDAVAAMRSLDTKRIRGGYTSTETVKCAEQHAPNLPLGVVLPWRVCSGFAHGRPWAYLGVSDIQVTDTGESDVVGVRLTSNLAKALYPSLAAIHLLERLLRLYEQRSGSSLV
jgi:hypothetical protein